MTGTTLRRVGRACLPIALGLSLACDDLIGRRTVAAAADSAAADSAVEVAAGTRSGPAGRAGAAKRRPRGARSADHVPAARPGAAAAGTAVRTAAGDSALAESPPPAPVVPPRPSPVAASLIKDLGNLVRAQEQHLANQGAYAARMQQLGLRYLPHAGVNLSIIEAGPAGWVGRASNNDVPGRSCVVWMGRPSSAAVTDAERRRPARPGVPVCDSL